MAKDKGRMEGQFQQQPMWVTESWHLGNHICCICVYTHTHTHAHTYPSLNLTLIIGTSQSSSK